MDLISEALLALLENVVTDTLALGEGDVSIVLLASNAEHVGNASGEAAALRVLNMHNLEGSNVLLTTSDDTNTALILTTGDHSSGSILELDVVGGFASGNVDLDSIVGLGAGVRVTDSAAIVGGQAWHALGAPGELLHAAELVLHLLGELLVVQPVNDEAALGVVEHAEVLVGLLNGDDIHESTWEVGVGAHLHQRACQRRWALAPQFARGEEAPNASVRPHVHPYRPRSRLP